MNNTAQELLNALSDNFMPNTYKPELGKMTELRRTGNEKVEFSIDWYTKVVVSFRPQTIGVKVHKYDAEKDETKTISKSYPLTQENLIETIVNLL